MTHWRFVMCVSLLVCGLNSARAGTLAQFRTAFGEMDVELYDQDKPLTVQNFIRYVQSGRFQNEFAHRLVPGFVVQGGGFTMTNRGTTNWQITPIPSYGPILNEFSVGRRFSNVYGTIAMAKLGGDTNSATSEWYFNLANNTSLDAPDTNNFFVVFGHVVRGTNVLNIFNNFQYYTGVQSSNLVLHQYYASPFDDLPLLQPIVADTNFVFLDITLLTVQVTATNHQRQVSWNSVSGQTNIVEYTTGLPPVWKTLLTTNGNGNRFTVTDSAATNAFRFYRVRVSF